MHEDEAKGNDDRHAWGCGDEKRGRGGTIGEALGAGELLYPIRHLYTGIEDKDGCTVKRELQSEWTGTYMPDLRESPFLFVSLLHTTSKRQSRR